MVRFIIDFAFSFRTFTFHHIVLRANLKLPQRPLTVHRLDKVSPAFQTVLSLCLTRRRGQQVCKPPSTYTPQRYSLLRIGVMLVALTKSDARQISALFQRTGVESNTLEKHYLALIGLGHVKTLDELQETHLRIIKNSLCNNGDGRMSLWREELQKEWPTKSKKLKAMSECEPLATSVRTPQLLAWCPRSHPIHISHSPRTLSLWLG